MYSFQKRKDLSRVQTNPFSHGGDEVVPSEFPQIPDAGGQGDVRPTPVYPVLNCWWVSPVCRYELQPCVYKTVLQSSSRPVLGISISRRNAKETK
jgi:hypothetical protein